MMKLELGSMYAEGEGVQKGSVEAFHWIQKAAETGYPEALCRLARMYAVGDGTTPNSIKTYKWFLIYRHETGRMCSDRDVERILESLSADEIAMADTSAREWNETHYASYRSYRCTTYGK